MTESFVEVNGTSSNTHADTPQKKLETSLLVNSIGTTVHREGVFIGDPSDVDAKLGLETLSDGTYAPKILLVGSDGTPVTTSTTAYGVTAIDFHDAHVHTKPVNRYFADFSAVTTTITVQTASDGSDYDINVADGTSFSVGDYIDINTTSIETTYPQITAISGTTPAVLTLDRRLERQHDIGDVVTKVVIDMSSAAGTMAAPKEYIVSPPSGEVWHMQRLIFEMTHGTAGDLGLFGNLTALTNGVVIRYKNNGSYINLSNWKDNSDAATDMYDVDFDQRSGGGGTHGTRGRWTILNSGAVIRLDGDTDDAIEVYIQDDITGLETFSMKAQGHVEGA